VAVQGIKVLTQVDIEISLLIFFLKILRQYPHSILDPSTGATDIVWGALDQWMNEAHLA
jgi:hypothetical protein